ncbi:MAG: NAD(P)H-binding protein [Planctomycetota bacterium]
MTAHTFAVTAANGNIGRPAVEALLAEGHAVRAVVRSDESAAALKALGADVAVADVSADADASWFTGCDGALLITPVVEGFARIACRLIDAAHQAGVANVVRVSIDGAFIDSGSRLGVEHAEADRHLAERCSDPGQRHTSLRPSGFMQNLLGMSPMIQQGVLPAPTGEGRMPLIDARDIAACAVAALSGRGGGTGPVDITGPEALTFGDVAERIAAKTGRPVAHLSPPPAQAEEGLRAMGIDGWLLDAMMENAAQVREGIGAAVRQGVETLTGRPPRSIDAFLDEHAPAFTPPPA